jgi:RNA polymerase sigma-70 factor (ECF subfamily)
MESATLSRIPADSSMPASNASRQSECYPPDNAEALEQSLVDAFNQHRNQLVNTLFFMLGNHADALDALQTAFLNCWRTRQNLATVRSLRAWIFRIGVNAAKDLQRNAYRQRARPLAGAALLPETNGPSPMRVAMERETETRLRQALLLLRSEEREVFSLRFHGQLSFLEIAELRHCPEGTVKTQMRAAIMKLRQLLHERANPTP